MGARSRDNRITISGVKLHPHIGTTPEERRMPQLCQADLTVWGDFEAAASTDALDKALDYSRILATAVAVSQEREYNLVETLAYRLARAILSSFPARRVSVKVRKRPASLMEHIDFVEVEVEES